MKKKMLMVTIMLGLMVFFASCKDEKQTVVLDSIVEEIAENEVSGGKDATKGDYATEELVEAESLEETENCSETEEAVQTEVNEVKDVSDVEEELGESIESTEFTETEEAFEESKEKEFAQEPVMEEKPQEKVQPEKVKPEPTPVPHSCVWDGGKVTSNATCNSEGIKTYTCTGCGSTRTESIAKTTHNYVTESSPATCTEVGTTKTYCSICGNVQSESAGETAKGHTPGPKSYWPKVEGPTCTGGAYYNIACSVCGELIESGNDPALEHSLVGTVTLQGDCVVDTVVSYDCSVCGHHIRDEFRTEEHNWVAGEADYFNEDILEWEKVAIMYCTRCNRQQQ